MKLSLFISLLLCTVILAPIQSFADEEKQQDRQVASEDLDQTLCSEMQSLDGFQPSDDMQAAVEALPDAE